MNSVHPIQIEESPKHGDIVGIGFDSRDRLYVELFDSDLDIARRFYEDRRLTRRREIERDQVRRN